MVLRVGCVPEHFSAPLVRAAESGEFPDEKIELMMRRLEAGELDVAICVTEGLVAGINDNAIRLFGTFVETPLPWAVSVRVDAEYATLDDLAGNAVFGASRQGSGSDVMARYMASQFEWGHEPHVRVVGDIRALVKGVQTRTVDAFLWERTTMQRHYKQDEVRYLGTVRPPWPAFSYAAQTQFIQANGQRLRAFMEWAQTAAREFMNDVEKNNGFVCERFGYAQSDVAEWAEYVRYSEDGSVDRAKIAKAVQVLERAGVIQGVDVDGVVLTPEA
ncbi:hypothetical protein GGH12_001995 [Coemansia sp. RSA 1822]|nr:hypothetical protein IW147_003881 [Coemansia sp. RSA 720]KAJ2564448.1 hypothetical protein GGH12_001995 [Coemansia sp. RSA 1822]